MIQLKRTGPPHALAAGLAAAGLLLAASSGCMVPSDPVIATSEPVAPPQDGAAPPDGAGQAPQNGGVPGNAVFVATGAVEARAADMEQDCGPPTQGGVSYFATLYSNGAKALTLTVANRDGAEGALLEDHRSGYSYVSIDSSGITIDPIARTASVDADLQRTDGATDTTHVTATLACP